MKRAFFLVLFGIFAGIAPVYSYYPMPLMGRGGIAVSDNLLASRAGVQILQRGGNAIDAACATAFALGVVSPSSSGLGGGGFMLIRTAKEGKVIAIDFRETAPVNVNLRLFKNKKLSSRIGGAAVAVPGELAGCALAHKMFGRLPWKELFGPAISLASTGFLVSGHLARAVKKSRRFFRNDPVFRRLFRINGRWIERGDKIKNPLLASTLRELAEKGPEVFYHGWIARDIVETVKKNGGVMTLRDLRSYKPKVRKVLTSKFFGYQIYSMPPPSSGGIVLIQILNIFKAMFKSPKAIASLGHNSSRYLHFLIEGTKHAFADRAALLGDPDFVSIPVKRLLSLEYAENIAKKIVSNNLKTLSIREYGLFQSGEYTSERGGTSHLNIADKFGNIVSMTTTINTAFGSKLIAPKSGIVLNNQMDDFTTDPDRPNFFGLKQSKNNIVHPGKRPLSSMTPTIVIGSNHILAIGASGGPTIITGTVQSLLNELIFKFSAYKSIASPRFHHQWLPNILFLEEDIPMDVRKNLIKYGHKKIEIWREPFTSVQILKIVKIKKDLFFIGASDPRKGGKPAVVKTAY